MSFLNRPYQYINILSLDVVAGAIISALFFAEVFQTQVYPRVLLALGLSVWIIYTIDHLRDAKSIKVPAATDRHRFHQRYFKTIAIIVTLMLVVNLATLFFLPMSVLRGGFALACIVFLYLIFQRHLKFLKEFFVACLYTAGVLLPSLASVSENASPLHYLVIGKFIITALMNLLLFSLFDLQVDRRQHQHSFVTWFGARSTRYGIVSLAFINVCTGVWLLSIDAALACVFISMNLLLLSILALRENLVPHNYYRMLGDAAFFLPVFYLL